MIDSAKWEALISDLLREYLALLDGAIRMLAVNRLLMRELLALKIECAKLTYKTYAKHGQGWRLRTPEELRELDVQLEHDLVKRFKQALKRGDRGN